MFVSLHAFESIQVSRVYLPSCLQSSSVLQCVAVCCSVSRAPTFVSRKQCVAACCSVLQCVTCDYFRVPKTLSEFFDLEDSGMQHFESVALLCRLWKASYAFDMQHTNRWP